MATGSRRYLDIRLLIGLGLVVASVAGVVGLVSAADRRTVVLAAPGHLSPGDLVHADDLVERSVALDGAEGRYLTAADIPSDGIVIAQHVADGELVPVSAAGRTDGIRATALVVQLATPVSAAVGPGALVDVWGAAAVGSGEFGPPVVLVAEATVVRVLADESLVAGAGTAVSVELLIPRSRIARLLAAIANGDSLAVVPAGLPLDPR